MNRKEKQYIRRVASEYGMLESDARQMIAFQRGETKGDMHDIRDTPPKRGKVMNDMMHLLWIVAAGILFAFWAQWVHRSYDRALKAGNVPLWLFRLKTFLCYLGNVDGPPDPRKERT